jgi:hypothetical protein
MTIRNRNRKDKKGKVVKRVQSMERDQSRRTSGGGNRRI